MKRYVLHILYVLSAAQLGQDYLVTATPVLAECEPATLVWTVTPSTPFTQGPSSITLLAPAPGQYEVHTIDTPTCQGLLYLDVPSAPEADLAPQPTKPRRK